MTIVKRPGTFLLSLIMLFVIMGCSERSVTVSPKTIDNPTEKHVIASDTGLENAGNDKEGSLEIVNTNPDQMPKANLNQASNYNEDLNYNSDSKESTQKAKDEVNNAIPVLYYHSVLEEPGNELRVPPAEFAQQMKYLAEQGYKTISLDQLYKYLINEEVSSDKLIAITFDDGYEDNYLNAFPIMQEHGYTGTVFMVTDYIEGKNFLSKSELQEMVDNGWQIEGHSMSHSKLVELDQANLNKELANPKEILQQITGKSVRFFAYPYGQYNNSVIQKAKEDGYNMAFTTARGWVKRGADPMLLNRVFIYANIGMKEFARRLQDPSY